MQRVLIVDDHVETAVSLCALLRKMGHQAEYALDALTALQIAQRRQPDVVVLDLRLPGVHGAEMARQLRRDPRLKHVRILAVSGLCTVEDRDRALSAGCDQVLTKPVPAAVYQLLISGTIEARAST